MVKESGLFDGVIARGLWQELNNGSDLYKILGFLTSIYRSSNTLKYNTITRTLSYDLELV
jgi:hypothetical protein